MKFVVHDFKAVPVEDSPKLTFLGADTPNRVFEYYQAVIEKDPGYEKEKEHVVVICLNTRLSVTGWHMVSVGGLSEASCHPREVFRPVIAKAAYAFVLCHNHPSGDPSPSRADIQVTQRLKEASTLLQIEFSDHVIIGSPGIGPVPYYSFREAGVL